MLTMNQLKWTTVISFVIILTAQTIKCHQASSGSKSQLNSTISTRMASNSSQATELNRTPFQHQNFSSIVSPPEIKSTNLTTTTRTNSTSFGDQTSASLLRSSIVKNLFKFKSRQPKGSSVAEDEDEVITKTIMVPMSAEDEDGFVPRSKSKRIKEFMEKDSHKPEASLQLTRTEMNKLLTDGEGPELYREREIHGEGVSVGEEPATGRYRTSASMGSANFYGSGGGFGNPLMQSPSSPMFGSSDSFSPYQHQLSQAGSEMGGGVDSLSGFNHRFGAQAPDDSFYSPAGGQGRMMQSPNEYSEMHSNSFMGQSSGSGEMAGFPASGLPRAASEYAGSDPAGDHFGGGQQQMGMYGSENPMLDRHASELYGSGGGFNNQFGGGGGGGEMMNQFDPSMGRLSQAGSHSGMMGGGFTGDEFASRYGNSPMMGGSPFGGGDQRAFASQQNMMRGGSPMPFSSSSSGEGNGRLMPLSPVVPAAEEVSSTSHHQTNAYNQQQRAQQYQRTPSSGVEVHEGFDDDPVEQPQRFSSLSNADDDSSEQQDQFSSGSNGNDVETTMASVQDASSRSTNQQDHQEEGHSLVLNLPPPVAPEAQYVEFSRKGSAGYYGPTPRQQIAHRSTLATSQHNNRHNNNNNNNNNNKQQQTDGLISAHAGKYIID